MILPTGTQVAPFAGSLPCTVGGSASGSVREAEGISGQLFPDGSVMALSGIVTVYLVSLPRLKTGSMVRIFRERLIDACTTAASAFNAIWPKLLPFTTFSLIVTVMVLVPTTVSDPSAGSVLYEVGAMVSGVLKLKVYDASGVPSALCTAPAGMETV